MFGEGSVTKRAALSQGPRHLDSLSPERKWVRRLKVSAKCLKGRHRPQIDGDLLGLVIERAAVNDLDVQPRQTRGGPCCFVFNSLTRLSMESIAPTARIQTLAASPIAADDPSGPHLLQTRHRNVHHI
jgi:hypothetical protein